MPLGGPTWAYYYDDQVDGAVSPEIVSPRLYAGQPDPNDASRFTIRYASEVGSGYIEGRLNDAGDGVRFRHFPGPVAPPSAVPPLPGLLRLPPLNETTTTIP